MAKIILPSIRISQPNYIVKPSNNGIVSGLVSFSYPGANWDVVKNKQVILGGNAIMSVNSKGKAWKGTNSYCPVDIGATGGFGSIVDLSKPWSMAFGMQYIGAGVAQYIACDDSSIGNNEGMVFYSTASNTLNFLAYTNGHTASVVASTSSILSEGEFYNILVTSTGGSNFVIRIYIDGILVGSSNTSISQQDQGNSFRINTRGAYSGGIDQFRGYVNYVAFFNENKSSYARQLASNPWQLLAPQNKILFAPPLSGGDTTIIANNVNYSFTGTNTSILSNKVIDSVSTNFIFTGTNSVLTYTPIGSYILTANNTNYIFTGVNAELLSNKLLDSTSVQFTLVGTSAGLLSNKNLPSNTVNFTVTGTDTVLLSNKVLTSEQASYTLGAQDSSFTVNRVIQTENVSYTISGQDTSFLVNRILQSGSGNFLLNGQVATLIYTPSGSYLLISEAGAFNFGTQAASLLFARILQGGNGNFILSGIDTGLLHGYNLPAGVASYLETGQSVTLSYNFLTNYSLLCGTTQYNLTEADANFIINRVLSANYVNFSITGSQTGLIASGATVQTASANWQIVIKTQLNSFLIH